MERIEMMTEGIDVLIEEITHIIFKLEMIEIKEERWELDKVLIQTLKFRTW